MATRVNTWSQHVTRKVNVIDIGGDRPNLKFLSFLDQSSYIKSFKM